MIQQIQKSHMDLSWIYPRFRIAEKETGSNSRDVRWFFLPPIRWFDWEESVDIEAPLSALLDPTGASSQRNAANWGTLCIIKLRSGVFNLCCGFTVMPVKPSDHASNIFNPCRCPCAEESGKAGVTWDIHTLKRWRHIASSAPMLGQVCEMFGHPTTLLDPGLQSAAILRLSADFTAALCVTPREAQSISDFSRF